MYAMHRDARGRRASVGGTPKASAWPLAITLGAALSASACSLLFNLDARQCSSDGDCKQFGAKYSVCSSAGVCVTPGTGGAGGATTSTTRSVDGGTSGCASNQECITAHNGAPYLCRNAACQPLTLTPDCPFVIASPDPEVSPTQYLVQKGDPIIFGAFSRLSVLTPESDPYTLIFREAINEFMTASPGGVGRPPRPYVMVLCGSQSSDPGHVARSVNHLVNTVGVQAILAALSPADLATAVNTATYADGGAMPVFFMNPFQADNNLLGLSQDAKGLLWHMLGPYTQLEPAYLALINSVAAHVRLTLGQDSSFPINVALVGTNGVDFSSDMAQDLENQIAVNGVPLASDSTHSYWANTDSSTVIGSPVTSGVASDLQTFKPHIVISLGTNEFLTSLVPTLETTLAYKPFYVLSPVQGFDPNLTQTKPRTYFLSYPSIPSMLQVYRRMAGVNYAKSQDPTLYNVYLNNMKHAYPDVSGFNDRENLYDASYFLLYALGYASYQPRAFTGIDVANGMLALVHNLDFDETAYVGRTTPSVQDVLGWLQDGKNIALEGALGPPDFKNAIGARRSQGSVYCVQPDGTVNFDVRTYQALTDGGIGSLVVPPDGGSVCSTGL